MEKSRMYVYRGLSPEEPVLSSGYLCSFKDLSICVALLDDLFADALDGEDLDLDLVLHALALSSLSFSLSM